MKPNKFKVMVLSNSDENELSNRVELICSRLYPVIWFSDTK